MSAVIRVEAGHRFPVSVRHGFVDRLVVRTATERAVRETIENLEARLG